MSIFSLLMHHHHPAMSHTLCTLQRKRTIRKTNWDEWRECSLMYFSTAVVKVSCSPGLPLSLFWDYWSDQTLEEKIAEVFNIMVKNCHKLKFYWEEWESEGAAPMWQAEGTGLVCLSWRVGDCPIVWPACDSSPSLKIPPAWMAVCARVCVCVCGKERERDGICLCVGFCLLLQRGLSKAAAVCLCCHGHESESEFQKCKLC